MEKDFSKNVIKPGMKGFEYDKRVDYSSQMQMDDDNSWDENDGNGEGDEDDYFDDDFA